MLDTIEAGSQSTGSVEVDALAHDSDGNSLKKGAYQVSIAGSSSTSGSNASAS